MLDDVFHLWTPLKGCTRVGTGSGAYREPSMLLFFVFISTKPIYSYLHIWLSNLCAGMSNKTTGCTKSLPLNRNSAGGSIQQLPILPSQKCSSAEITNAMVFLFWVGLLPSRNDLPIRKCHSYKIAKGKSL